MVRPTYRRTICYCSVALSSFCLLLLLEWKIDEQMELLQNYWHGTEGNRPHQLLVLNDISDRDFYEKKLAAARKRLGTYSTSFQSHRNRSKSPLIVDWTTFFDTPMKDMAAKVMPFCPVQCEFSSEKSLAGKADAVVFHAYQLFLRNPPSVRHPSQRYIFWLVESPQKYGMLLFESILCWKQTSTVQFAFGGLGVTVEVLWFEYRKIGGTLYPFLS